MVEKYKKVIYIFSIATIGLILIYLFLKYLLGIILPFLISYLIVSLVRPIIEKICDKTKASRAFVTIFVLIVAMAILVTGIVFLTLAIANQIGNIFDSVLENLRKEQNFVTKLLDLIAKLEQKVPIISKFTNTSVHSIVTDMITEGVKSVSISLTSKIASIVGALPQIILTVIVAFLSLFYFAKDYDVIGQKILSFLPKSVANKAPQIKNDIILVVGKFVKSYMLLMFLTFAMLFAGFLVLGIKNSLVLAIIVAIVDILPIFGVGTVLVPWAIILLINGQNGVGIGMFILFGVIYIVRQYAEPKIVSAQMDVHPLVTLFSMYAGLRLLGIVGLIFAPLIAYVIKTVYVGLKKEKTVDKKE